MGRTHIHDIYFNQFTQALSANKTLKHITYQYHDTLTNDFRRNHLHVECILAAFDEHPKIECIHVDWLDYVPPSLEHINKPRREQYRKTTQQRIFHLLTLYHCAMTDAPIHRLPLEMVHEIIRQLVIVDRPRECVLMSYRKKHRIPPFIFTP